jgi:hypothetical protein
LSEDAAQISARQSEDRLQALLNLIVEPLS